MSFKSLTKELITTIHDLIVHPYGHFDYPPVQEQGHASLACISREWQSVVEAHNFRRITIRHQSDLVETAQIITPARAKLVSELNVNIQLDAYDEEARRRVETEEEQQKNSEVFTKGVRDLFEIVKDWDREGYHGLDLRLFVWSPSDIDRLEAEEQEALVKRLAFSPVRRYERSLIRYLDDPEELPALERVSWFKLQEGLSRGIQGRNTYRTVDPETAGLLVEKCRRSLDYLSLNLMDWPRGAVEERKRRRKVFAGVLDKLPPRVSNLSVVYWGSAPRDEEYDPPNLLDEGEEEDALSISLRRCYMRSKPTHFSVSMTILGVEFYRPPTRADKGFYRRESDEDDDGEEEESDDKDKEDRDSDYDEFWGRDGGCSDDDGRPCSELTDLVADWPKVNPDGRWLYRRPDEEGAWEEWDYRHRDALASNDAGGILPADPDPELDHPAYANKYRFRLEGDPELFTPLMMNMARLMRRMPALSILEWRDVDQSQDRARQIEWCTNFNEGGGDLTFHGFGQYDDDGDLIETEEPPIDGEVIELFREMLSARKPEGEVIIEFQ
ncbi:hypothetical protein B0T16DRAFT_411096 [Cercophora newfieldiana]|uniref:F-box domain-containing protein n=1 Tax=Cercophora newfieldiana TaxID=92897 RepID=A0AA40CNR0_9PEZI|nr:hypothetical protein B0T16DRAFT_411096 [Cercophora newfieldiana]